MLARYDAQLRTVVPDPLPEGLRIERDGPLVRYIGYANGGGIGYRDLDGIEGTQLDELIARQIQVFAERGEAFEWKSHGHDRPADLPDRLLAHGFEPEDLETIVIASVAAIAREASSPDGVSLREVTERADFDRIGAMEDAIWRDGRNGWLADSLEKERAADPDAITIVVAESAGEVVCAGWVRFVSRHGLRDAVGWRHAPRVAASGHLSRVGRLPRQPRGGAGVPLPAGGRVVGEPTGPGAHGLRRGHDDDAVHLDAAGEPSVAQAGLVAHLHDSCDAPRHGRRGVGTRRPDRAGGRRLRTRRSHRRGLPGRLARPR